MVIYCSGIGGIGLSAYAALQSAAGNVVRGSDKNDSALIQDLRDQGVEVFLGQDGTHVTADIDLFVYSEAVPPDAPERKKATELGIEQQSYFHALGVLSEPYDVIAICGTHGKSSTTAMAAKVFVDAGLDPTIVVGTKSPDLGGRNWRKGTSNLFIVEACEYRRSFHFLSPDTVALTTVDGDHFDAYGSLEEYRAAFVEFLGRLPEGRPVVFHGSDAACGVVVLSAGRPGVDADSFALPELGVAGEHMRQNARLVLGLAAQYGIAEDVARASLKGFSGTWRRMETKGTRQDGVTVIDDYAHHPAEIRASLQGIREANPGRRIVCVFQPHTHDRTLKLYDEFLPVFKDADLVVIPNVYAARSEVDGGQVDLAKFIADVAKGSGVDVRDGGGLDGTLEWLSGAINPNDVVVTMGAGDVTSLAPKILAQSR
jgi:UDP-N-acetylmuramate--alanine ligase